MRIDFITKILLLSISIALWGIFLKPILISDNANASNPTLDVNIKRVNGQPFYGTFDVNVKKVNGRIFNGANLPVEIKQ